MADYQSILSPVRQTTGYAGPTFSSPAAAAAYQKSRGFSPNGNPLTIPAAPTATPTNSDDFLKSIIPGFTGNTGAASSYIGQLLTGNVPKDVTNQIQDKAAAWGVNAGVPGFGSGSLTSEQALKNLGLTSLGEEQTGYGDLLGLISGISSPTLENQGQQFQQQQFGQNLAQRQNEFNRTQTDAELQQQLENQQWQQQFAAANPKPIPNGEVSTDPTTGAFMGGSRALYDYLQNPAGYAKPTSVTTGGSFGGGRTATSPAAGGVQPLLDGKGNPITDSNGNALGTNGLPLSFNANPFNA